MSANATIIGSVTRQPSAEDLGGLATVDVLEIRADLVGEVDLDELRAHFGGRLLYTLRSRSEGGAGPEGGHEREERLLAAAAVYDLVDLEAQRDLYPEILDQIPPQSRIISWHGKRPDLAALEARFAQMSSEAAHLYKLVSFAESPRDCLPPLVLLHHLDRDDVVAFAAGEVATWTRFLAARLGAPVVYGAVGKPPGAPGQPSIRRLEEDFGLPELPPVRRLFGLVGHPISHSLSPRLHNMLYHSLGIEHLYLPFDVPVFGDFWLDVVETGSLHELGFPLSGLSITSPFKEIALAVSGAASPLAERIGSANTLVRTTRVWEAETTDPDGIRGLLAWHQIDPAGRRAAVLGAGGAGRAAVFGLGIQGAAITLVNRSPERGRRVANDLGVAFLPFEEFDPGVFDIVVNATPLGSLAGDELPFDPEAMAPHGVVIDLAYLHDGPTPVVEAARRLGRTAIDGREALLYQAVPQFRAMNGVAMPIDLGRRILGLEASGSDE